MNNPPVSYLQTDPRWRNIPYAVPGESATIGGSGCGPTAMAMVLATWVDPAVTPQTECAWSLANGGKAFKQGTYYSYFPKAAARYGLTCYQLNAAKIYGNAYSEYHKRVKAELDKGNLVIACMGKGLWTSSGHFVLVWKVEGNTVYINDPASTRAARTRGDYALFKTQVKYYFVIERPEGRKEEADMTEKDVKTILANLTDEEAYTLLQKAMRHTAALPEPGWSAEEGYWQRAKAKGITDGTRPQDAASRVEVVTMMGRMELF